MDPFTQQIIRPILCHRIMHDEIASVPRANNLTGVGAYVGYKLPYILAPEMSTAMYVGLLSDPEKMQGRCSTGNCTFPSDGTSGATYQTLAIESRCRRFSRDDSS